MPSKRETAADRLRRMRKEPGFAPVWRRHAEERLAKYGFDRLSTERIVRNGAVRPGEPDIQPDPACAEGVKMFRRIEHYEERGLGLPYPVILKGAAEEEIDENGERVGMRIPNLEGLAAVVALARCLWPYDLAGSEVRFIRRVLGYTQKELAGRLEMRAETLSRWENRKEEDEDRPVGEWADKSVRMLAAIELSRRARGSAVDPNDITALRIRLRKANTWPNIVAEQVRVRADGGTAHLEWDALPQVA